MSLDIIQQPFAFQGDRDTPDQTSATGFVNFQDGYTKDYEISLESGNPQAKAVERMVQNYMFNQATEHAMAWQRRAMPPWFAGMSDPSIGGYPKDAFVIRQQVDLSWKPYRSLVANNVSDPLTTPAQWEYVRNGSESLALIPMPSGAGNAAAELIAVGVDFNTLTASGTYEVRDDAVAAACTNLPVTIDGQISGVLEVKAWTDSTPATRIVQRYTSSAGRLAVRYAIGAVWTGWTYEAFHIDVRNQKFITCTATTPVSAEAIILTGSPAITARAEGMRLRFKAVANTVAAVTINDGISVKPLLGYGGIALIGGEIKNNFNVVIEWNVALDSWLLVGCQASPLQTPTGSYLAASPAQFDATKKLASMEAVQRALGNFQTWSSVANGATMPASLAGGMFGSAGAGAQNHFLPSLASVPIGASYTYSNTAGDIVAILPQSGDGMSLDGSPLTSFQVLTGQSAQFMKATAGTWLVINAGVNRGPGYRAFNNIGSNYLIASKDIGKLIYFSGNNVTISMPTPTSIGANLGDVVEFFTGASSGSILSPAAGATVVKVDGAIGSISLKAGQSARLVATTTTTWQEISSTADLGLNSDFAASQNQSGYQKLPSGLIIQWVSGANQSAAGNQTVSYPIAFPNAVHKVLVTSVYANGTSQNGAYGYISTTNSQVTVYRNNADNANGVTPNILAIGF